MSNLGAFTVIKQSIAESKNIFSRKNTQFLLVLVNPNETKQNFAGKIL